MRTKHVLPVAVLALVLSSQSAFATMQQCQVGQRVEGQGKTGTVVAVDPGHGTGGWCTVDQDDGTRGARWPAWMLSPAGTNAANTAQMLPGHYECWGGGGASASAACSGAEGGCASMHYLYQDINIGNGIYADKNGKRGQFSYNAGNHMITYVSGPYAGWYSKYLDRGKIGISVRPTNFWNIVCDRK